MKLAAALGTSELGAITNYAPATRLMIIPGEPPPPPPPLPVFLETGQWEASSLSHFWTSACQLCSPSSIHTHSTLLTCHQRRFSLGGNTAFLGNGEWRGSGRKKWKRIRGRRSWENEEQENGEAKEEEKEKIRSGRLTSLTPKESLIAEKGNFQSTRPTFRKYRTNYISVRRKDTIFKN